ncbi:hypothetical protein ACLQ28_29010 [Micromonospora sp. DT201]|uniref:hypothetical protein n=1 Tax=Micromonospora sp. DT201 TaxID=3393442 RepID=UPI003CE88CE1
MPIDAGLTQAEADRQLATYLAGVQAGEPLCIRAHGNDEESGDAEACAKDWGWIYKNLARMLATHLTATPSVVLIRSCAEEVTNFLPRWRSAWSRTGRARTTSTGPSSTATAHLSTSAHPSPRRSS